MKTMLLLNAVEIIFMLIGLFLSFKISRRIFEVGNAFAKRQKGFSLMYHMILLYFFGVCMAAIIACTQCLFVVIIFPEIQSLLDRSLDQSLDQQFFSVIKSFFGELPSNYQKSDQIALSMTIFFAMFNTVSVLKGISSTEELTDEQVEKELEKEGSERDLFLY